MTVWTDSGRIPYPLFAIGLHLPGGVGGRFMINICFWRRTYRLGINR